MNRQDIEAGEQQWLQAFNGRDAAGVARLYTEDGRILPPNAEIQQGQAAIEAFVDSFLQLEASLAFDLLSVHESPDLCAAVGRYELTFRLPGEERQTDAGKFVEIWARQPDGSWLIAEDIFNSSTPLPSP
jgi:uncharacterized protein (TIGR02246 family)